MTLLVFGSTGQVATELRALAPNATFLGRDKADLTDPTSCFEVIKAIGPRAVINAAAYTAVDSAEEDEATAIAVNGQAPAAMAKACADLGIPFIHISTDYVFPGDGSRPWQPSDATGPLNAYGRSKLAGELAIRDSGAIHAILRTSWVYSAHGANFVKTMLRLSESRDRLTVVGDQVGGPTPARAIAAACLSIAENLTKKTSGTYHFSGAPDVSWADFARAIFALADRSVEVVDIPTREFPTPARRPSNSRMDCTSTKAVFGIDRPDWRAELSQVLADLGVPA